MDHTGRFLDHTATDGLAALWSVLCYWCLRRGEAAALRWSDLDLGAGTLSVRKQLTVVDWQVQKEDPKSEKGKRTFALDAATVATLKMHRKSTGGRSAPARPGGHGKPGVHR